MPLWAWGIWRTALLFKLYSNWMKFIAYASLMLEGSPVRLPCMSAMWGFAMARRIRCVGDSAYMWALH